MSSETIIASGSRTGFEAAAAAAAERAVADAEDGAVRAADVVEEAAAVAEASADAEAAVVPARATAELSGAGAGAGLAAAAGDFSSQPLASFSLPLLTPLPPTTADVCTSISFAAAARWSCAMRSHARM